MLPVGINVTNKSQFLIPENSRVRSGYIVGVEVGMEITKRYNAGEKFSLILNFFWKCLSLFQSL